ncbi:hypothetical protein F5Y14DRAFT_456560 [Nemania sp. NC0429]|nr:hypothetical protein F5Y14DRAFT_456560 [Nemania sp. NC0429]
MLRHFTYSRSPDFFWNRNQSKQHDDPTNISYDVQADPTKKDIRIGVKQSVTAPVSPAAHGRVHEMARYLIGNSTAQEQNNAPLFVKIISITRYQPPIMDRPKIIAIAVLSVTVVYMIVAAQFDPLPDDPEHPPLL